ncbi:MAG TPA: NUDIX hydrolase [Cytophagales bacterium]|nr:NUDIX hydrolase [Cytophagales bacterium]HAA19407.1 NUDIX hydrolase [Cytophagales bacterium]HAP64020.1 NUDIX hydrolase [Cytophagales bacterium]
MGKKSAGILLFRLKQGYLEVLLVHPGGPFFKNKDLGSWSIPKGEFKDESPLQAAIREFKEETGFEVKGDFLELTPIKQRSGKMVYAWALEGDLETSQIQSNTFELEWPPKSGKIQRFPEIDHADWFSVGVARQKINGNQVPFIDQTISLLGLSDSQWIDPRS